MTMGCRDAGLPLTSPKTYSAAFTDDAHMAMEAVQQRFPGAPLFAVGFSLGAVILTKYLAEADSGHWEKQGGWPQWSMASIQDAWSCAFYEGDS
jgi:predicted alpha/beta-fold hydrolase